MTAGASVAFVLNLGALLPIIALFVSAFLGAYVFGLNPRGPANRSVLLVMIAFVVWDVGEVVQRSLSPGTSPDVLFFWARVTWVAIAFVPAMRPRRTTPNTHRLGVLRTCHHERTKSITEVNIQTKNTGAR